MSVLCHKGVIFDLFMPGIGGIWEKPGMIIMCRSAHL